MITFSFNPNRSDVRLNLEYAEVQLERAMKKALNHHFKNAKLRTAIANALSEIKNARLHLRRKER